MSLHIYNSLTNNIEEFIPIDKNRVTMYVCGMTVYNYVHIGNARPIVFFDMFKRYLAFLGYNVSYASNATDVDDKIINKAILENTTESVISARYIAQLLEDTKNLGSLPVDHFPKATEYIPLMIAFIEELLEKGYAYEADGDVFFRVSKLENYGILSNQNIEALESGSRVDVNDKKENPLDFALWKKTDRGIKWESSFGSGRPGWHTECVVMINKVFGGMIDVHGGGMDLKFPHHENEIAQQEALHHNTLAKYFMHVGRLDMNGEKMSKSIGNVIFVKDLKTKTEYMTLRMLLLFSPYRAKINYTSQLHEQFGKEYIKFSHALKQYALELHNKGFNETLDEEAIMEFKKEMDNDFNTPNVLTILNKLLKEANQAFRGKDYQTLAKKNKTIRTIFDVLGVDFAIESTIEKYQETYDKWNEARVNKDFAQADTLRAQLIEGEIL